MKRGKTNISKMLIHEFRFKNCTLYIVLLTFICLKMFKIEKLRKMIGKKEVKIVPLRNLAIKGSREMKQ